jgi:hypothetical protein
MGATSDRHNHDMTDLSLVALTMLIGTQQMT